MIPGASTCVITLIGNKNFINNEPSTSISFCCCSSRKWDIFVTFDPWFMLMMLWSVTNDGGDTRLSQFSGLIHATPSSWFVTLVNTVTNNIFITKTCSSPVLVFTLQQSYSVSNLRNFRFYSVCWDVVIFERINWCWCSLVSIRVKYFSPQILLNLGYFQYFGLRTSKFVFLVNFTGFSPG